jgi:septal ring factor EnvC (AmiA/AmiB activator)
MGPGILKRAVLCVLTCWALGASAQQAASPKELQRLKSAITALQQDLGKHRGEHSALQKQLQSNEVAIGNLSRQIDRNAAQIRTLEQELGELRTRQRDLALARTKQQTLIAAQLRSAYQLGQEKNLKVLLNQQDPARISRAMTYVDYLNRARLDAIAEFSSTIDELAKLEPAIQSRTLGLAQTGEQLAAEKEQLASQQNSRRQTLASLSATIQSKDAQLKQHQQDRQRLENLLNTVEDVATTFATMDDAKPFASRKGKMSWPTKGKIVTRFGSRRHDGGLRSQGVEIRASKGSSVTAVHHGRVVFADWFGGQGLLLIIDHGDGFMSLYGHNQSLLKETGDWIHTGEIVATVGDSGGRSEAGLYFEIRQKGKASNPAQWCRS